ncbi:ovomucoid-like isoform X1 [Eublepharis macularius]|uniref:Ovomucoid-like isoform X1 n=1 Tax=Eublepharis macularius TaxID=481883 RepID=A0AA97KUD2_EUBMA|nr:ovomucoid-like isoform X1 [Eublepharis macularius]
MKTAGFLLLNLTLCLFYSGIAIEARSVDQGILGLHNHANQVDCRGYPRNVCTLEHRPHCGTDGITYSNACFFCNAYVHQRGRLRLKHKGACRYLSDAQD